MVGIVVFLSLLQASPKAIVVGARSAALSMSAHAGRRST
jgi:hypothetical protein